MIQTNPFVEKKDVLSECNRELLTIISDEYMASRVEAAQKRLTNEKMKVLVVGEFSRGKSTFINSILGRPILPSKVNPTTTTINIIEGALEQKIMIEYTDKSTEQLEFPTDKVNKFLEGYVTVANQQWNRITKVNIYVDNKLKDWNCVLVDTPGVNDLDASREDITFKYLSEADACIVLLDSQQPLSESERDFIKNRVLKNDVNRLLFVINRFDEAESFPNGPQSERIIKHVQKLIVECIPEISDPVVYTVSSKEALKGRFKNESNEWETHFNEFERHLVKFIADNAIDNKLSVHAERTIGICRDLMDDLKSSNSMLSVSQTDLESIKQKLLKEKEIVNNELKLLDTTSSTAVFTMKQENVKLVNGHLQTLRTNLLNMATSISSEDEYGELKVYLSNGIRDLVELLRESIEKMKTQFEKDIKDKCTFIGSSTTDIVLKSLGRQLSPDRITDVELMTDVKETSSAAEDAVAIGAGLGIGILGGMLFGPVGIAATILIGRIVGKHLQSQQEQRELEALKQNVIDNINIQISNVLQHFLENNEDRCREIIDEVKAKYVEMANSKLRSMEKITTTQFTDIATKQRDISSEQASIASKMEIMKKITSISLSLLDKGDIT